MPIAAIQLIPGLVLASGQNVLAETGEGQRAVCTYIANNRARRNAHSAIYKVRRRVEAALALEEAICAR